jgi:FtsP/CotA-like multicopper oxidase with cupredoxin domain
MDRRTFLKAGTLAALASGAPTSRPASAQTGPANPSEERAQYTIRIGTGLVELAPDRIVSTTTYNRQSPGPLLRFTEGQRVIVDIQWIGTAERVSAIVQMKHPGIWVLGDLTDDDRRRGMGIVVEYAGRKGKPQWMKPRPFRWDYTRFVSADRVIPSPDEVIQMTFAKVNAADHGFNQWTGVMKDVVMLGGYKEMDIDFTTDNPGLTLFHCHMQLHMDYGFMALFDYA